MKKIYVSLLLCLCLLAACERVEEGEDVKNQGRPWAEESTEEAETEYIGEVTAVQEHSTNSSETVIDEEESKRLAAEEESRKEADKKRKIDSVMIMVDLINQKHMPIFDDTLVYSGERMSYAASLTNDNDFQVRFTFMILINGNPQPFMIDGESGEIYSKVCELQPYEEKVEDFSFVPICAPYGSKALFTLVGIAALKEPLESRAYRGLNLTESCYSKYITAGSKSEEIKNSDHVNAKADILAKMQKNDYENTASGMKLSNTAQNEKSVNFIQANELKLDIKKEVCFYFAQRAPFNERCFFFKDGLLANVFDGKPYVDFQGEELYMYRVPVDVSSFDNGKAHDIFILDTSLSAVSETLKDGTEGALADYDGICSNLYTTEK